MMSDYLAWCEQMRHLPLSMPGAKLESTNKIKVVTLPDKSMVLSKAIRSDVVYIRRLKILGEVAYNLFDYYLNPTERVTPNVCPISSNILCRQFVRGESGDIWRGSIYKATKSLQAADLAIFAKILQSPSAQRIALLDLIFLCQDRSARNWIIDGNGNFWAIDNGIFWAYKGRYVDKRTVKTGRVDHLRPPMEALISKRLDAGLQIGIFSSLYAGRIINDDLLAGLGQINWPQYLSELNRLIGVLGYPFSIIDDWRFMMLKARARWLLGRRRFPTMAEAFGVEWRQLIDQPVGAKEEWKIEWETENLEKK